MLYSKGTLQALPTNLRPGWNSAKGSSLLQYGIDCVRKKFYYTASN